MFIFIKIISNINVPRKSISMQLNIQDFHFNTQPDFTINNTYKQLQYILKLAPTFANANIHSFQHTACHSMKSYDGCFKVFICVVRIIVLYTSFEMAPPNVNNFLQKSSLLKRKPVLLDQTATLK
jgi:hypothetical protein